MPVLHGIDGQIVTCAGAGPLKAKLLKNATLKTYDDLPHGMCTTYADILNADLLDVIEA